MYHFPGHPSIILSPWSIYHVPPKKKELYPSFGFITPKKTRKKKKKLSFPDTSGLQDNFATDPRRLRALIEGQGPDSRINGGTNGTLGPHFG